MNKILAESYEKGHSDFCLKEAVECIRCHRAVYFVTNIDGNTVCFHCGGEHVAVDYVST